MPTLLPMDLDNNPIPALRLKHGGAHTVSATDITAKNTTAFDAETRIISLYADVPVYLAFGNSTVTATSNDHYFPAGIYYDFSIGGDKTGQSTYLAVLAVSTNGTVYISEKE